MALDRMDWHLLNFIIQQRMGAILMTIIVF